jgi:hypothetical protein
VRERAPVVSGDMAATSAAPLPAASPAPEPSIPETKDAAESGQPRRTGWWSRRFAGG